MTMNYIEKCKRTIRARELAAEQLREQMQDFREYLASPKFAGDNDYIRTWEVTELLSRLRDTLTAADDAALVTIGETGLLPERIRFDRVRETVRPAGEHVGWVAYRYGSEDRFSDDRYRTPDELEVIPGAERGSKVTAAWETGQYQSIRQLWRNGDAWEVLV